MEHADSISLIVWGIREGRQAAAEVDSYLMGSSRLAWQGGISKRDWIIPPALDPSTSDSSESSDSELVTSGDEDTVVENVSVVAA
jgi:glutamate synthase (NADPH/NADH)